MIIEENAYAKLNISLDVGKRREDGFHEMVMIMQTISLCDDVRIELNESGRLLASTNLPYIPKDEKNLAVKAAKLYFEAVGKSEQGARISIRKRIPVGAGMAGGSSDAAAVLRALNRAFDKILSDDQIQSLAEKVGSDVAFCVRGGTMLATGRGELLKPLRDIPSCGILVCKPSFSISTPELFRKLDMLRISCHPDTEGLLEAVEAGNLSGICRRMYNVFEDVDDRRLKIVSETKKKLLDAGADGAIMTGTGSAVFGLFATETLAFSAWERLKKDYSFCRVAQPVSGCL